MKDKDQKLIWEAYGQPEGSLYDDMEAARDKQFAASKKPGYHPKNFPDKSYEMARERAKQFKNAYHKARIIKVIETSGGGTLQGFYRNIDMNDQEAVEKLQKYMDVDNDPSPPRQGDSEWEKKSFMSFVADESKEMGVLPMRFKDAIQLWLDWDEAGKPELDVVNWSGHSRDQGFHRT